MLAPLAASLVQPVIYSVVKGKRGRGARRVGKGYLDKKFLNLPHPLNNIQITNYLNFKPRFNGAFSGNNLPKIKDGMYFINLDDISSKETHWISLFID